MVMVRSAYCRPNFMCHCMSHTAGKREGRKEEKKKQLEKQNALTTGSSQVISNKEEFQRATEQDVDWQEEEEEEECG